MVDCCKTLIDDTSAITFEENNQSSINDGNQVSFSSMRPSNIFQNIIQSNLKRNHSMRDDNRARATANRKFDNFKKVRYDTSFFIHTVQMLTVLLEQKLLLKLFTMLVI